MSQATGDKLLNSQEMRKYIWALTQYFYHRCSTSQPSQSLFSPHDFIKQGLECDTKRLEWLLQGVYLTVLLKCANNFGSG